MKIIEVINSLSSVGGAQTFFCDLCLDISNRKDVELKIVILYDGINSKFQDFYNALEDKIVFCHKKRSFDLHASKLLKQIIISFQPDIINFHLNFYLSYYLSFGIKNRKWKLVKTYHSIPGNDESKRSLFLEKKFYKKKLLHFIGISNEITNKSKLIYPKAIVQTIENGIKLRQQNSSVPNKEYDFIIVASLEPVKNHILLFSSFKSLLPEFKNLKLLCLGSGSLMNEYISYLKDNEMTNNVYLLGKVDDVYPYLQKTDIFVLSSIREGNPISILEAMNAGLPIIAPSVGGIPDIITHDKNGLLFSPESEEELTKSMKRLLLDKKLKTQMAKQNIEDSQKYSITKTGDEYISFFQKLLDGTKFD